MTGPVGPNPTAGLNAMIPYEPWNQDIVGTDATGAIIDMSQNTVYFIQFIAPSTGYYTKATMLVGFEDVPGTPPTKYGFAIFDNSGEAPLSLISGNKLHGVPRLRLGQAMFEHPGAAALNGNQYLTANFGTGTPPFTDPSAQVFLTMDEPYWFAFAVTGLAMSTPIYAINEDYESIYELYF